jgi:hypothetical protein
LVWTNQLELLNNQHYVSKAQYELLNSLKNKVSIIITDGALLTGLFYNEYNVNNLSNVAKTKELIKKWINEFDNMYVLVERNFPYEIIGRVQDEKESLKIHEEIKALVKREYIEDYMYCQSNETELKKILDVVIKKIK